MTAYEDSCQALAICISSGVPVVLWGPPGQGKTSVIKSIAEAEGMKLETVIASIREPSDFAGLPIVDQIDKTTVLAAPRWAKELAEAGEGIVFYDEISTAPPAVQAALLRPILEGWVGDLQLPDGVRTVAAANPPDQAADGWDLAPPAANRFCHLDWSLPADVVREGFSVGWPKVQFVRVDKATVQQHHREAKILVGAFLGTRPELVTQVPTSSAEAGRAFPTPRSWDMATRLYATARAVNAKSGVIAMLLSGTVGMAAREFLEYARKLDLPDPEELIKDPASFVVPVDRGDMVYAITASVWNAYVEKDRTKERCHAVGDILAKIAEANYADIAFVAGVKWANEEYRAKGAVPSDYHFQKLAPILVELGKIRSGQ